MVAVGLAAAVLCLLRERRGPGGVLAAGPRPGGSRGQHRRILGARGVEGHAVHRQLRARGTPDLLRRRGLLRRQRRRGGEESDEQPSKVMERQRRRVRHGRIPASAPAAGAQDQCKASLADRGRRA
ncbi:unnamed protein product [Prorocentrum cordatum]|uniref:Uncharacterized protein n=1 Tax=Prorocentrum cordatum TaxID=2364126 RepID=A0ABN9SZC0_9DINO|nr:unnamed protein product [Polarella glacialis]